MTGWRWIAVAATASVLIGALAWGLACNGCVREIGPPAGLQATSLMAAGSYGGDDTAVADAAPAEAALPGRPVELINQLLFVEGSLRGTDFPDWGTPRGRPLRPHRVLRDRFDYYLLGMGEASVAELGSVLRAHAARDLGEPTAVEVMAVWERYLQLQRHKFVHVAKIDDVGSMQTSLQEHQQVRQALLGLHWANAFYGDEELKLAAGISREQQGSPQPVDGVMALFQPAPGTDPQSLHRDRIARFGADKAQRLREIDEAQQVWEQRMARAKDQVAQIRHDSGLSAPQRVDAIACYLDEEFGQSSTDRLRAVALIEGL